ncbi:hypothetical protein ES703_107261 [subsurface metagenome]
MDHHLRMQKERPRIKRIYVYWFHYYRMRRVYWLTDIWLEQCRRWKKEIRRWERPGAKPDLRRARILRKSVHVVEDGLIIVEREQKDTEKIARARDWRIRWPRPHRRMTTWIGAKRRRITAIRRWIKRIKEELPLLLHRIKIRLYNEERKPTPTGMFQGFFDIDALIDPVTELVNWDWWLTKEEISIAKYHFIGYFKGMATWRTPEQVDLAYFDEPTGVPSETARVKYEYSKRVPSDFIIKAETLTVGELIVGESSVEPEPNPKPAAENMGVFVERFMVISADGLIKWDEIRNKFAWHPTEDMVKKVKAELGIA